MGSACNYEAENSKTDKKGKFLKQCRFYYNHGDFSFKITTDSLK